MSTPPTLARSSIDRGAVHRLDEAWLAAAWADAASRVLRIDQGKTVLAADGALELIGTADAGEGDRYFLGVGADGEAYFAVVGPLGSLRDGAQVTGLREAAALLSDTDAGLLVHAVALEQWHRFHQRCPRCGAPTVVTAGGHMRRCPEDGSEHYPRTDPAVIMLVHDDAGRCLLGRQASWPAGRFSTLAGFVEPGESLEQAVAREVAEEVGVAVTDIRYVASQPWPFPSSLMLGFMARAVDHEIRVDGVEIEQAQWFTRADIAAGGADGALTFPPSISISRQLIELWYGEPLPVGSGS